MSVLDMYCSELWNICIALSNNNNKHICKAPEGHNFGFTEYAKQLCIAMFP